MNKRVWPWRTLVCLLIVSAVVGCGSSGPAMGRVNGQVTYKDNPVADAMVTFAPSEAGARAAMGKTDSSGKFSLTTFTNGDGALVGSHKVSVVARAPFAGKIPDGAGEAYLEEMQSQGKPLVPEKYFSIESSGLTAEVKSGSNSVEFKLTD